MAPGTAGGACVSARRLGAFVLAFACASGARAQVEARDDAGIPRHPLEVRALVEPDAVLRELPAAIEEARRAGDAQLLAALELAHANACRVKADWPCQRDAGREARFAAERSGDPVLKIRGLIAESRGNLALQDYTRGERLLGLAQAELERHPNPVLAADVFLAYSSLSSNIDKHALAIEYADRGLAVLGPGQARATQARLLRNRARAQVQIGDATGAERSLAEALEAIEGVVDPKLRAELHRESAQVARLRGDVAAQREHGTRILELGRSLSNTQLTGIAHEVLGGAALAAGDVATAESELRTAQALFRELRLARDELRVARDLIELQLALRTRIDDVAPLVRRALELERTVLQSDRAQAADDFDARLDYAQRELDVGRLRTEAALARERFRATLLTTGASVLLFAVLGVFYALQRRSNRRLRTAMAALRESEARATDLLLSNQGYVFLHDSAGRLTLVNPATADALGAPPSVLVGRPLLEFVPESRREDLAAYLRRVELEGHDEGTMLIRRRDGVERYWRFTSRRSDPAGAAPYVICTAVDVTAQTTQAETLREQSVRDALTGSYNRRRLESFEAEHGPHERWGVVCIDLDHFKRINDVHGHERGDQVLIAFAQFLGARVREGDAVVRAGGDEFVVLIAEADEAAVARLVRRLHEDAAAAPCAYSLGSAVRADGEPLAATLARADEAMYALRHASRAPAGTAREPS